MREKIVYTNDMMSLESLPSFAFVPQKQIAEISDILFDIQQDKQSEKAAGMMKIMAEKLKVSGLSGCRHELGSISHARLIDRAAAADKEAGKISDSFQTLYIGLCKENVLLDTMNKMLEKCIAEIEEASDVLREHIETAQTDRTQLRYIELAKKKLHDMAISKTVALQGMALITDMTAHNSALTERINSLRVNTLVLWRSDIAALKASPDKDKLERICGIEDVITAAIANIFKQ